MQVRRRIRRAPSGGDHGSHWISYSDMMASLLLVFVLAVIYSVYQYYSMLEIKTQQLNEQQAELDRATITLVQREEELEAANVTLMGKQEELAAIQIQLDQQENDLHAAQDALKTKEEEQALLQLQLATQADALAAMQSVLDAQRAEMLTYQRRIDDMVGVRSKIIQELSRALTAANLGASVDKTTGDIVLESTVFFDSNSSNIKDEGRELLARFLPVYLGVLTRPEYADYVGEIVIEGHTDTAGSYLTNLRLSQNRALSVAEYCLQLPSLSRLQITQLQNLLTAKGRSYSDPIYKADGTVDMDASRRVEFKFRLKDAEMIEEMNRILTEMEGTGTN
ncbi:MAG: OmpA family protein [Clostridia bacterium]|nr:OmpA family protein [Clostridia bacterium]